MTQGESDISAAGASEFEVSGHRYSEDTLFSFWVKRVFFTLSLLNAFEKLLKKSAS